MNEIIDARTGPPTKCESVALTPACSGRTDPATTANRSSSSDVTVFAVPSSLCRRDDRVRHDSDPFDLHLHDVPVFHRDLRLARPADAGRRAGEDQVAGVEREHPGDECDEERHIEDQV